MGQQKLVGRRILISADDSAFAFRLSDALGAAGADVIYPANTIEDSLDIIMSSSRIDAAILSLSLQGEVTFVAAENLVRRRIPFAFLMGQNAPDIPEEFKDIVQLVTSGNLSNMVGLVQTLIIGAHNSQGRGEGLGTGAA
ncbi:hypothetical protein NKH36_12395 [Mesorhizobium sp. M1312]|uniref:hypothetical protein n=1 Tax=unclassified Mesorhizobium TaxID=325217 RepID=UPI003336A8B8